MLPRLLSASSATMTMRCVSDILASPAQREESGCPGTDRLTDDVDLTVVLPMFNEEDVVEQMYRCLKTVAERLDMSYELLFVDDGSSDSTAAVIREISLTDACVGGIFLSRHFGKEAALTAGLEQARGRAVIIMDGDLQDPPELIPYMLSARREGADVVRMRAVDKKNNSSIRLIGRSLLCRLVGADPLCPMPEHRIDFMLYSRRAVSVLGLVVNRKRYMNEAFEWAGLRQTMIDYERQPRTGGSSRWCLAEFLGHSHDGAKSGADILLRVLMLAGLFGFITSLLHLCYAFIGETIMGSAGLSVSFAYSVRLLIIWTAIYSLGRFGEAMVRLCPPMRRPRYSIKDVVRCGRASMSPTS